MDSKAIYGYNVDDCVNTSVEILTRQW
jgi:hypothetical protein